MSKLSDYIKSGGALIEGNTTLSNATGIVDIDLTSSQAYTIEQGTGDLTINVISAVDARADGYLAIQRNLTYAVGYTGVAVYDPYNLLSNAGITVQQFHTYGNYPQIVSEANI